MNIYDKSDNLILQVDVDDNSYRNRAIMGDHDLMLYYSLAKHVEIPIGAYCDYEGQRYTLLRPEQFKMQHTRLYEYTVTFESDQSKAKIWKFRNPVDGRLKFSLTAKPKEHLQMMVDNMNRHDSGWKVGECIDDVEKLITYDHDYCWDALSKQATEFKTEFEFVGKTVSLHKVEYNKSNPLPLAYGKGNGFKPGTGRTNSGDKVPTEILYVQGGERNIDRSKYPDDEVLRASSSGCLLLPVGQTIDYDGEHFEDEDDYNANVARHYVVDSLGLSIRRADKALSSGAEDSLDRSDDYPKRTGTISRVIEVDQTKNLYDFIDADIPQDLDYGNKELQIGEENMTVIFQSGMLAGREFDVKYFHTQKTVNGQSKAGRRFEIVPQEIDGVMMPGNGFVPAIGDTYAVFGVMLPSAYIRNDATKSGASWDMFRAAVKYLFDNEQQKFTFTGELDGLWAKQNWTNIGGKIRLGGFVKFAGEQFGQEDALVRITSIKDYINKPHSPKIELSNETVSAGVPSTLRQLESTEVVIDENRRAAVQYTKRRFRDAKETIDMIEKALSDNFSSRINPIAVETMSMLVGDKRLQFQFVAAPGSDVVVPHNIEWNQGTKQLTIPAGTIRHLTLDIDSIKPSHAPNEYHYWAMPALTSAPLLDGSLKYYLYIKASKNFTGSHGSASFQLDTDTHSFEEGSYYWLLVGVLNSEYDSERSFATLYGFTEILPGQIRADKLISADGNSYFDMLNSALKLKDKLQYNVNGDGELRIKGVIVQSQGGGEAAPLGCYRGMYNDQTAYFNGDEVVYQAEVDGPLSTYRCISTSSITGVSPTNSLSWQITAAGTAGKDGSSINIKGRAFGHYTSLEEMSGGVINMGGAKHLVDSDLAAGTEAGENTKYCLIRYYRPMTLLQPSRWVTEYADPGDAYIIANTNRDDDGHLYVADSEGWVDLGNVKGEPGKDGKAGNYTEYRFAVSGSTTEPPALTNTALTPSGWSTTMPAVSFGHYIWLTKAIKTGDGSALVGTWSTPVRFTPQDGSDGADGKSPALVYRGNYKSGERYYGTEFRLDCVRYNGAYYIAQINAGEFSGVTPTSTGKWNPFGASFDSVATELLLAEFAYIENLGVRDLLTNQTGRRVHISQERNAVVVYDNSDDASIVIAGETLSDTSLFGGSTLSVSPVNVDRQLDVGSCLTATETVQCGTFNFNSMGTFTGTVRLSVSNYFARGAGGYGSIGPRGLSQIIIRIDGKEIARCVNSNFTDGTTSRESQTVNFSEPISAGTHTITAEILCESTGFGDGGYCRPEMTATFANCVANAAIRQSHYFANGNAIGCSPTQYSETIMEDDKLLHKVEAGTVGISLHDGVLKIKLGDKWYTATRNSSGQLILT